MEAVDKIQADCPTRVRTLTLALYVTLTHLASEHRGGQHEDFIASRRTIAERCGMSLPTLDKHADVLEGLGLLEVERRREGQVDLPSRWSLTGVRRFTGGQRSANLLDPYARETSGSSTTNVESTTKKKKKDDAAEPLGFDDWLEYHCDVTGSRAMSRVGTRARATVAKSFAKAVADGYSVDQLKHVSAAVWSDEWRRNGGHTSPESVLVPKTIERFLERPVVELAGPSAHQAQLEQALAASASTLSGDELDRELARIKLEREAA